MGKTFVHLSEFIPYYEEDKRNGTLSIGRGCGQRLRGYMETNGVTAKVHDLTVCPEAHIGSSTIALRPYQEGIPEKIALHRVGVCRFDTGFGKTILALKVVELLQTKTLILVPRTSIYEQFRTDVERLLGKKVVTIRDPSSGDSVVSTTQGLQRFLESASEEDRLQLKQTFGLVIVDECHTTIPKKSRACIEFFNARYRYGFTATNRRTDGQGDALGFLYGPVIADGKVERETPIVYVDEFKGSITMGEYHEIIAEQVTDEDRNKRIVEIAKQELSDGRRILILTKRVEHYAILQELLEEDKVEGVISLSSTASAKGRAETLGDLRSGDRVFQVLLGTFSLLSTGVDIPSLDTLILAGDLKSDVLAEQSAGRILRLFSGKRKPKIVDIHDMGNPILRHQGRERRKFYARESWDIRPYESA